MGVAVVEPGDGRLPGAERASPSRPVRVCDGGAGAPSSAAARRAGDDDGA